MNRFKTSLLPLLFALALITPSALTHAELPEPGSPDRTGYVDPNRASNAQDLSPEARDTTRMSQAYSNDVASHTRDLNSTRVAWLSLAAVFIVLLGIQAYRLRRQRRAKNR